MVTYFLACPSVREREKTFSQMKPVRHDDCSTIKTSQMKYNSGFLGVINNSSKIPSSSSSSRSVPGVGHASVVLVRVASSIASSFVFIAPVRLHEAVCLYSHGYVHRGIAFLA